MLMIDWRQPVRLRDLLIAAHKRSSGLPVVNRDRWLVTVSGAQLAAGLTGMAVAIKRRRAYDFLFLHGNPHTMTRDAFLLGTAYSAPVSMLVAQAVMTTQLLRGRDGSTRLVLGLLGVAMVPGYLGEAQVRRRLRRSSWDRFESPLVLIGIALAALMAMVGLSRQRHR